MGDRLEIFSYYYVNRPYLRVRDALVADPPGVLREAAWRLPGGDPGRRRPGRIDGGRAACAARRAGGRTEIALTVGQIDQIEEVDSTATPRTSRGSRFHGRRTPDLGCFR